MRLHHICKTIFSELRTMQRRGIIFLLIGTIVLAYWGCGSSNNNEPSRGAEGNGSGLQLAIQMPSGSDPSVMERFEISVTGPGIPLFDPMNNIEILTVGDGPVSVALGDMDGDGVVDVVTANQDSDDVSILFAAGARSFSAAQSFSVG